MLGVPVLAGSCAYAIAEAMSWGASLDRKPKLAPKFYGVLAVAMALGVALDYVGLDAVKMLFWSAVANGVLAPPLIVLVVLLTTDPIDNGRPRESAAAQMAGLALRGGDDCRRHRYVRGGVKLTLCHVTNSHSPHQ